MNEKKDNKEAIKVLEFIAKNKLTITFLIYSAVFWYIAKEYIFDRASEIIEIIKDVKDLYANFTKNMFMMSVQLEVFVIFLLGAILLVLLYLARER